MPASKIMTHDRNAAAHDGGFLQDMVDIGSKEFEEKPQTTEVDIETFYNQLKNHSPWRICLAQAIKDLGSDVHYMKTLLDQRSQKGQEGRS